MMKNLPFAWRRLWPHLNYFCQLVLIGFASMVAFVILIMTVVATAVVLLEDIRFAPFVAVGLTAVIALSWWRKSWIYLLLYFPFISLLFGIVA